MSLRPLTNPHEPVLSSLPVLLVLPLGGVVDSQFNSLALPTQHGAAVPHAAHHQLDAVPQERHGGGSSRVYPRYYRDINKDMRGRRCRQNTAPHQQTRGASHTHKHGLGQRHRGWGVTNQGN